MAGMAKKNDRVRPWQTAVIALSSAAFFLFIPSLGKTHHWSYWALGLAVELVIVLFVLQSRTSNNA